MSEMPTSMIERVAAALWFDHVDQHGYPNGLPTWDELTTCPELDRAGVAETFRSYARAAIEAMREPTEAMVEAGRQAPCETGGIVYSRGPEVASIYRAMLDAALTKTHDQGEG